MPVFIERFLLPVVGVIVVALIVTNPMNFDWTQRISGALALTCAAYFFAHTLHLHNIKRETAKTTQIPPESPAPKIEPPKIQEPGKKAKPRPPVAHIRFFENKQLSADENLPFVLSVTLQTDMVIQPTHLRVDCDGQIAKVDLPEPVRLLEYSYGVAEGEPNAADIQFAGPAFSPEQIIRVVLFSKQALHVKGVRRLY